jgi:hypothetical protein
MIRVLNGTNKAAMITGMDYSSFIQKANADWLEKRTAFTKEDIRYIANKDTLRGRMNGFLTLPYYRREKLIRGSEIYFAFVFQDWANDLSETAPTYPTWLLFSPERKVQENPSLLRDISLKVQSIRDATPFSKEEKKLKSLVVEQLSDVSYFEIPAAYSCGELAYLSVVYRQTRLVPFFRLGLNLILANPVVSKEVLYLPERYWPEDYQNAYTQGSLVF